LTTLSQEDLQLIKELLPRESKDLVIGDELLIARIQALYEKIIKSTSECSIDQDELKNLNFLISKNAKEIHRLGNLALLDKSLNSGLSNHFFDSKRKIIVQKVSEGKFVPFHTYDIFSKLIIDGQTSLHVWTKDDIDRHETYLKKQVATIVEYLNN